MPVRLVVSILVITMVFIPNLSYAVEAARFAIPISGTGQVEEVKHHFSISLLKGWVSSEDSWFESLISGKAKLVLSIDRKATFFDGKTRQLNTVHDNKDIERKTDRPWGLNLLLLKRVPADANIELTLRLAVEREDRISEVFNAAQETQVDEAASIFAEPWVGYSKVIGNIISRLFGTDETSFPFFWKGNIKLSDIAEDGKIDQHYLILIAPKDDDDGEYIRNLDKKRLSFDEKSNKLTYDGKDFSSRSYAILKIEKVPNPEIEQLLFESNAPWAVLGQREFLVVRTDIANDIDQLKILVDRFYEQLQTELNLLKAEQRFSKFDRAKALLTFSLSAEEQVRGRCRELNRIENCPTHVLSQFAKTVSRSFGLPIKLMPEINEEARGLLRALSP